MRVTATAGAITDDGVIATLLIEPDEARILWSLAEQLRALLSEALDPEADRDTALRRLLPDAYRHEPELADEWRRLSRRGLVERKLGFAHTLATAVAPIIDAEAAQSIPLTQREALDWVRGVGDVRLAIADRLGIIVDGDLGHETEPGLRDVYEWLAWLQDSLVQVLEEAGQ